MSLPKPELMNQFKHLKSKQRVITINYSRLSLFLPLTLTSQYNVFLLSFNLSKSAKISFLISTNILVSGFQCFLNCL